MKKILLPIGFVAILCMLSGCYYPRVPIRTLSYPSPETGAMKDFFIFYPGIGGTYKDFEKKGVIQDLKERLPQSDAIALDAHFGYYLNRSLDTRVKKDVLDKMDMTAYCKVYLVGFSMGGLGTILTARKYPENIDGILLISPFLGWDGILDEIKAAGGLREWQPGEYTEKDWQRMVWDLLKKQKEGPADFPPLYLAYGQEDTYIKADILLREIIPPDRVVSRPGKHNIPTFQLLWRDMVNILPEEHCRKP